MNFLATPARDHQKYKSVEKKGALELIGKHLAMFTDKVQSEVTQTAKVVIMLPDNGGTQIYQRIEMVEEIIEQHVRMLSVRSSRSSRMHGCGPMPPSMHCSSDWRD